MKRALTGFLCAAAIVAGLGTATPAKAGADPFIGEIIAVGFNFCPRGWMEADGRLLPIADNNALFSLFGTYYGGDGRTTFGLPDLRGRVARGAGEGPGLPGFEVGQRGGGGEVNVQGKKKGRTIAATVPYQVVRYCVAVQGIYPSRN